MSTWQNHSIERRIRKILKSVPDEEHHFGRPFLSAYQIAIAFDQRLPALIGKPVDGKGTGRHDSLARMRHRFPNSRRVCCDWC